MQESNDPFFDIRPYHDDEVPAALKRLVADKEFLDAIITFRYPDLNDLLRKSLRPFVQIYLSYKFRNIKTVRDVQLHVANYMVSMLKTSSTGFNISGIEKLDPKASYLFISNHRDIAMDPAFVNWSLYLNGFNTVRIAIGDNLLQKPCANELMKLNKSFIVKRSAKAPREMIQAFSQLSAYIKHSIDEKQSVWIAQKEGRAKDGDDRTDPAILKMFYINGKSQKIDFVEYMKSLRIVPITLSYENDPCDIVKAKELYQTQTQGSYKKKEFEDITSIVKGIVGKKGRIHVAFGDIITEGFSNPEELTEIIDKQIYQNYKLFPSNYIAAEIDDPSITEKDKKRFTKKLSQVSEEEAKIIKTMYAMPVYKKLNISKKEKTEQE